MPAVRTNNGFNANVLPANDDGSTGNVPIGFSVNFFGTTYSSLWVNNNGNVTFVSALATFTPFGLTQSVPQPIIAAFFADVDTRGSGSNTVKYGKDVVGGRPAFGVNYLAVGYFNAHSEHLNSFQLLLIDRSDVTPGDFDIEFNYGDGTNGITWETGTASGGSNDGRGGQSARVGYSNGATGDARVSFELPGSGVNGAFLDSADPSMRLLSRTYNTTVPGRLLFTVRGGIVVQPPGNANSEPLDLVLCADSGLLSTPEPDKDTGGAGIARVAQLVRQFAQDFTDNRFRVEGVSFQGTGTPGALGSAQGAGGPFGRDIVADLSAFAPARTPSGLGATAGAPDGFRLALDTIFKRANNPDFYANNRPAIALFVSGALNETARNYTLVRVQRFRALYPNGRLFLLWDANDAPPDATAFDAFAGAFDAAQPFHTNADFLLFARALLFRPIVPMPTLQVRSRLVAGTPVATLTANP